MIRRGLWVAFWSAILYLPTEILATYIGGYAMMLTRAFGGVGGI